MRTQAKLTQDRHRHDALSQGGSAHLPVRAAREAIACRHVRGVHIDLNRRRRAGARGQLPATGGKACAHRRSARRMWHVGRGSAACGICAAEHPPSWWPQSPICRNTGSEGSSELRILNESHVKRPGPKVHQYQMEAVIWRRCEMASRRKPPTAAPVRALLYEMHADAFNVAGRFLALH